MVSKNIKTGHFIILLQSSTLFVKAKPDEVFIFSHFHDIIFYTGCNTGTTGKLINNVLTNVSLPYNFDL